jgi:hypothetical protein
LVPSPDLNRCITKLAKFCHQTTFPKPASLSNSAGSEIYYTPLTFNYILDSIIKRLGQDCWSPDLLDIAPQFFLARKTLGDWKNGKKMIKLTAGVQYIRKCTVHAVSQESTPLLRLVFVRKDSYKLNPDLSGPDVHFIDNFELEFKYSLKEIKVETVSFLLACDHGFDETYDAIVVNASNGMPLLLLDPFESMRVEEYGVPYPIDQSKSQLPLDPKNKMYMKVESCIESEEQYTLRIAIECSGNVSGE